MTADLGAGVAFDAPDDRQNLPRRFKARIGEIIMIGAEIDQLVSMALLRVTSIGTFEGLILLDRTQISTKFKKLQVLVDAAGHIDNAEALDEIEPHLEQFLRGRNTFAHGVFKQRQGDDVEFAVTSDLAPDPGGALFGNRISTYDFATLGKYIWLGERIIARLREVFAVQMLHEEPVVESRATKPPSPRSLRKSKNAKPPRPPRSSPA